MVTLLRPIEVRTTFEDRGYVLGETVDVEIELEARRDVAARTGRVALVCHENYSQTTAVTYNENYDRRIIGFKALSNPIKVYTDTRQVTRSHRESYTHSGTAFLSDVRLETGETYRYRVGLEIGLEPPLHMDVSWSLEVALDVAWARDVVARHPIRVEAALPTSAGNKIQSEKR